MSSKGTFGTGPYVVSRRHFLRVGIVLASVPLLEACGGGQATPAPTAAPAKAAAAPAAAASAAAPTQAAAPAKLVPWRAGEIMPTVPHGFTLMAFEKGFMKEAGFDVEVTMANSAEQLRAMVADRLDIVHLAPGAGLAAPESGAEIKMVAVGFPRVRDFIYAKKEINSVKDLAGKRIGSNTPNTSPAILLTTILTKNQVDPAKVQMVALGNDPERMAALLAGQLDATLGGIENMPTIQKDPNFKVLLNVGEQVPDVLGSAWFVTDKLIKDKPDVLTKVLVAYAQGIRYGLDHLDEAVQVAMKSLKSDPKDQPVIEVAIKAHRDYKLVRHGAH